MTKKKILSLYTALGLAVGGYFISTDTPQVKYRLLTDSYSTKYQVVVMDQNGTLWDGGEVEGLMKCSTKAYFVYNDVIIANANKSHDMSIAKNTIDLETWESLENDNSAPYFCCKEYPNCSDKIQYSKEYKEAVLEEYKNLKD